MASRKSSYYKQNKAAVKRKLKIDTSGKETGASKGRRFVLWAGITAIIALFVVVGTAGLGSVIAPPNQVVLTSESHAISVFTPNGSKIPFASTSTGQTEYSTSSNTTYILTNVTMGEMAQKNVGKLSVNLTPGAVSPGVVASSGVTPDTNTSPTYSVTFNEHNLTHLVSPKYWCVVVQDAINGPDHAPQYEQKSVNTSVSTTLANGSYYFLGLTNCTGFTDPFNISFTVAGKALNLSVSFEQVYSLTMNVSGFSGSISSVIFTAAITQIDLPSNYKMTPLSSVDHYHTMSSAAPFTVNVTLTNGTYYAMFTVGASFAAPPQIFTISGAASSINVSFSYAYTVSVDISSDIPHVTFTSGSAIPYALNVTFNNLYENSTERGNTSLTLSNGTYGMSGYAINSTTGVPYMTIFKAFTVKGANLTVNLTFEDAYHLMVSETGLLKGTSWTLHLSTGQNLTSSTTSLSTLLAKDTYNYTITASGYTTLNGNISLTANETLNASFKATVAPVITATISIGFGTSPSNFVPLVSNVTNISYAMFLIQPYYLTGNQSAHLMIEINTTAGSGLKYVVFELLGNNGTFSSFGPIHAEDFGYVVGGTIILALTFVTVPWIAIYREQWVMSERKVN